MVLAPGHKQRGKERRKVGVSSYLNRAYTFAVPIRTGKVVVGSGPEPLVPHTFDQADWQDLITKRTDG